MAFSYLSSLSSGCKHIMHSVSRRPLLSPYWCGKKSHLVDAPVLRIRQNLILPSYLFSSQALYSQISQDQKSLVSRPVGSSTLPSWQPPTSGLLSKLPVSWIPFAELIRIDKPTGTYYLFFPCLFSTLLAAPQVVPCPTPLSVLGTTMLFFTGAFIMRGAGCTINDLWDRNLDTNVSRTRLRPIARGAITPFNALVFTGAQLMTGLGILIQFPQQCLYYGIPSLFLVATYPLAKRFTHYPQIILGLTFSWGAIMGFPALGIDLLNSSSALKTAALIYGSNIAWTVLYDMIYAHMDFRDDAKAGIKSIVLRHGQYTKQILSGLAVAQVGLLAASGIAAGSGPVFFLGSCGGAAVTLAIMIKRVDIQNVKSCWWWFVNGCWITGGVISTGMAIDYILRLSHTLEDVSGNQNSSATNV